jgi:hypothetical protein
MILPTEKIKAKTSNPTRLIIYSKPKTGKTELCTHLDTIGTYAILDVEGGTKTYDSINIQTPTIALIKEACLTIVKKNKDRKEKGLPPLYEYGVIDPITKLEDLCQGFATEMYRKLPIGKNFGLKPDGTIDKKANVVTALPNGGGYLYLREAFKEVLSWVEAAFPHVIMLGHLKDISIEKNGKEVSAKELDLTGKIKSKTCIDADAIGYLYRKESGKNYISFITSDEVLCGSRSKHLANKEILISELPEKEDEPLITHWDKIYLKK